MNIRKYRFRYRSHLYRRRSMNKGIWNRKNSIKWYGTSKVSNTKNITDYVCRYQLVWNVNTSFFFRKFSIIYVMSAVVIATFASFNPLEMRFDQLNDPTNRKSICISLEMQFAQFKMEISLKNCTKTTQLMLSAKWYLFSGFRPTILRNFGKTFVWSCQKKWKQIFGVHWPMSTCVDLSIPLFVQPNVFA